MKADERDVLIRRYAEDPALRRSALEGAPEEMRKWKPSFVELAWAKAFA